MFEDSKLNKSDDLSTWRQKINKIITIISTLISLAPKNSESVLVNNGNELKWEDKSNFKNEKTVQEKQRDLSLEGTIVAENIIINNAARFFGKLSVDKSITASNLTLVDDAVIKLNCNTYKTAIIPTNNGLLVDNILFNKGKLFVKELSINNCNFSLNDDIFLMDYYNKVPISVNFITEKVYCNYSLTVPQIYFGPNKYINDTEYSGLSHSALKLEHSKNIFGIPFNGEKDVIGVIKDCSGIISNSDETIIDFPYSKTKLIENNGILSYNGIFKPNRIFIDSEHYSEYYPSTTLLERGDVISFDFDSEVENYVKAKNHPLGVVTDDYSIAVGNQNKISYPVCNRGRVFAKTLGKVTIGDYLILSSISGVLRKIDDYEKPSDAWAIALQNSDNENIKLVKIHIL